MRPPAFLATFIISACVLFIKPASTINLPIRRRGGNPGRWPAIVSPQDKRNRCGGGGVVGNSRNSGGNRALTPAFVDDQSFRTIWSGSIQPFKDGSSRPRKIAGAVGLGSLFGIFSGFAAKRFGQAIVTGAGLIMVSMKVAEEAGYIAVNWEKIDRDAKELGDSLYGRESKLRVKAQSIARSFRPENAGMAGSFAAGFAWGFHNG